ncbi:MAG: hypothetical protein R3F14_12915 [Polyangiaceae bacterium]
MGNSVSIPAGWTYDNTASCPAGKKVMGGGLEINISGMSANDMIKLQMMRSFPLSDSQWTTQIYNENGYAVSATFWAICAFAN